MISSNKFPNISRSDLYEAITGKLDYHSYYASSVPKMLRDIHKTNCFGVALGFFPGSTWTEEFLNRVVTGDKT